MLKLILVRHGESVANRQGIYQGQTYNTTLTVLGKRQARVLSKQLKNYKIDTIYTSPLKRALETAKIIVAGLGIPIITNENLLEINHGDWEGRTKAKVKRLYPNIFAQWKREPDKTIMPNGEDLTTVLKRTRRFLRNLKQDHQAGTFLIVAHDTVLRVMIAEVLGLPLSNIWRFRLDNAALTIVQWGSQGKLLTLNNTEYLIGNQSDTDRQAL